MIAVIGRVEHVRVVELARSDQFAVDSLHRIVDALQRLQPLGHQKIGEPLVDRFHFAQPAQDPLLVRIGGEVVRRRPVARYVEKLSNKTTALDLRQLKQV